MANLSITKRCSKCREDKPHHEFYRNRAQPDGYNNQCTLCFKAHLRANKERVRATHRAYFESHRSEHREYSRNWNAANRDKNRERSRALYHRDIEASRAYNREKAHRNAAQRSAYAKKRHQENKQRHCEMLREWRASHPAKYSLQRYRARYPLIAKQGRFTDAEFLAKCEYFGWRCYLCHAFLTPETLTIDHRIPLVRGGSHWLANVAPCCLFCNCSKGARTEQSVRARLAG